MRKRSPAPLLFLSGLSRVERCLTYSSPVLHAGSHRQSSSVPLAILACKGHSLVSSWGMCPFAPKGSQSEHEGHWPDTVQASLNLLSACQTCGSCIKAGSLRMGLLVLSGKQKQLTTLPTAPSPFLCLLVHGDGGQQIPWRVYPMSRTRSILVLTLRITADLPCAHPTGS